MIPPNREATIREWLAPLTQRKLAGLEPFNVRIESGEIRVQLRSHAEGQHAAAPDCQLPAWADTPSWLVLERGGLVPSSVFAGSKRRGHVQVGWVRISWILCDSALDEERDLGGIGNEVTGLAELLSKQNPDAIWDRLSLSEVDAGTFDLLGLLPFLRWFGEHYAIVQVFAMSLLLLFLIPATVLVFLSRAPRSPGVTAPVAATVALFIAGWLLRLGASSFPVDIRAAYDMGFMTYSVSHNWAAGYVAYLHAVLAVLPARFESIVLANTLVGALTIPATALFAREYLDDALGAVCTAAAVAFFPILAKYSATDSPHVLLALAFMLSACFLVHWAKDAQTTTLMLGLGWLALAVNLRPEAFAYPVAAVLLVASCRPAPGSVVSWRFGTLAVGFLALIAAPTYRSLLMVHNGEFLAHRFLGPVDFIINNAVLYGSHAPLGWALLAVVGVLGARDRLLRVGVVLCVSEMLFSTLTGSSVSILDGWETNLRYRLPAITFFLIISGHGLRCLLSAVLRALQVRNEKIGYWLAAGLGLACSAPGLGFIRETWTHQREFEFVRRSLPQIPDGCLIVTGLTGQCAGGLEPSPTLSMEAKRRHTWITMDEFLLGGRDDACTVFYQAASCYSPDAVCSSTRRKGDPAPASYEVPACREMRERYRLEPIATVMLPVKPYVHERYARDPVRAGFYYVTPKDRMAR